MEDNTIYVFEYFKGFERIQRIEQTFHQHRRCAIELAKTHNTVINAKIHNAAMGRWDYLGEYYANGDHTQGNTRSKLVVDKYGSRFKIYK